jgi:predicted nucleotidyltransferase component of viral defense system
MITREKLLTISKKNQISEYVVAREYVQIILLKELYSENISSEIYFKGGTAIRLIYDGIRFSEDLDFTCNNQLSFDKNFKIFCGRVEKIYPFVFKEKETLTGKSYLVTGKMDQVKSPIYVRLDFSMRENVIEGRTEILNTEYPVIVQDYIRVLSLSEIFAEKIRAVIQRKKHRDLYDLWMLLELGAVFDKDLVENKLKYYGEVFDKSALLGEISKFDKNEFVNDLSPLVKFSERNKLADHFDYINKYLNDAIKRNM